MVTRASGVRDLESVLAIEVVFVADPDDRGWLIGRAGTQTLQIRMGNFPDEELWSLWLGHGRWMDFTEWPPNWTGNVSDDGWPQTCRPRLPKGEFFE